MEERIEAKVGVVIVAGGSGKRLGGTKPKQYQILGQQPMLIHTINAFAEALPTAEIVVVVAEDRVEYWRNLSARFSVATHRVVAGGAERFNSVKAGIEALNESVDIIAVHDGARPFCSRELILRAVECAISSGSAIPVIQLSDSVREVAEDGSSHALQRSKLRAVQTPQIFDAVLLRRGYMQSYSSLFTDESSIVESLGERVWLCEGESQNIKITTAEDLLLAEQILERLEEAKQQKIRELLEE
ncbi:MAG: 2-C-methyl-D-erythritol 4-phosphate cytidylyltransferase [Rikenellaceae bacterium]